MIDLKIKVKNKQHLKDLIKLHIKEFGLQCNLNHLDVSGITNMSNVFYESKFNGDISKWDTSNMTIPNKGIKGNSKGHFLFAVINIDKDDSEDSTTELWRANSENQLYDLIKAEYVGEEDEIGYEHMSKMFDENWQFSIIPRKIGKFN